MLVQIEGNNGTIYTYSQGEDYTYNSDGSLCVTGRFPDGGSFRRIFAPGSWVCVETTNTLPSTDRPWEESLVRPLGPRPTMPILFQAFSKLGVEDYLVVMAVANSTGCRRVEDMQVDHDKQQIVLVCSPTTEENR